MYDEIQIEEVAPWLVGFITLAGFGLRVLLLDSKGMWLDETFSVWLANHGVVDMLHWIVKIDQHPPLYYLLLHIWVTENGDAAYAVRMLSAIFGAATIPVIYLTGKRMSGEIVGLAAAILLAVSPFNIRFAQETRMYTLLTFNAAVAIYALVRLLTDPRTGQPIGRQFVEYLHHWRNPRPVEPNPKGDFSYKDKFLPRTGWRAWVARHTWSPIRTIETDLAWVTFIVFSAATMLTHNTAVLFPVATNIFVLGLMLFQSRKKSGTPPAYLAPSWGNWVKAQVGILILWSPWIPAFIQQVRRVYQEFWIPEPTWDSVTQVLRAFLDESTYGDSSQRWTIWTLYTFVLVLGVWYFRKNMSRFFFLAALFTIPFLGELIVSIRRPIFYDRTLIWLTIPLLLLVAAGLAQLKFRFLIILAVGFLGTNNLFSASDYFRFMRKEDWKTPAGYVANFAEQDDLVLFNAGWVQIPFDYYFTYYEDLYDIQVEKHGVPADMFENDVLEPIMTEEDVPRLIALIDGQARVWLVYSHNDYTDPKGLIPDTLAAHLQVTRERYFYGGEVQLYEAP